MGHLFADPSHQLFAGFNAFFSLTWQKTRVGLVSLKVFHLWRILGHPNAISNHIKWSYKHQGNPTGNDYTLWWKLRAESLHSGDFFYLWIYVKWLQQLKFHFFWWFERFDEIQRAKIKTHWTKSDEAKIYEEIISRDSKWTPLSTARRRTHTSQVKIN